MAGPSKAKRPKRRWVGIRISADINRNDLNSIIEQIFPTSSAKLYDLELIGEENRAIVRINLSEVSDFIFKCQLDSRIETLTTSGKIRLVRDRLGIPKPRVRR
ncbi:MAG: hypothetical protein CMB31_02255 [Euryarchaeota archaeon]|nr:hypothetical protein [Euryarchaeota archaeon]|tara:strand:- start:412 stop:720 length:309 start_codon:yes stop_codon:yes gene_type:complete